MASEVTILIPTCNRPEALAACLRLLVPQLPPDDSVGVIVCDDGDKTETRDMLARDFPFAARIPGPRRGPGANRNAGAVAARGRWIIFLDDDVLPHPGFLACYLAAIEDPRTDDCVLVGATFRSGENTGSMLWESPHYAGTDVLPPSCNFAISREAFITQGGFDERFRISFEDMEFFSRLKLAGVPVHYLQGAAVDHPVRPLPPAGSLASRWEARVISAFDAGAGSFGLVWRLPKHVFMVILSRFRGRKICAESIRAAGLFAGEFFITLACLPGWLLKYRALPRSRFWADHVDKGNGPPHFGL